MMITDVLPASPPRTRGRLGGLALVAVIAAFAGLSGGCSDDHLIIEEDLDDRPLECGLSPCSSGLRAPYVRGATVSIDVRDDRSLRSTDFSGWTLTTEDESVFVVTSQELGTDNEWIDVETRAVGEGRTELLLIDEGGDVRARSAVEVRSPTHITLLHRGTEESLQVDAPIRILGGETGTFAVHYWEGDTPLYGSGVASTASEIVEEDALLLSAEIVANRGQDYVQLTPQTAGTIPVTLGFGGEASVELEVWGVEVAELGGLDLVPSAGRFDGREGVFARGVDLDGARVYGAQALWSAGSEALEGIGDACLYSASDSEELRLRAMVGDLSAETTVRGVDPSVHSTNDFSCSVGGGATSAWGLVLLALGALRRRRASALS